MDDQKLMREGDVMAQLIREASMYVQTQIDDEQVKHAPPVLTAALKELTKAVSDIALSTMALGHDPAESERFSTQYLLWLTYELGRRIERYGLILTPCDCEQKPK